MPFTAEHKTRFHQISEGRGKCLWGFLGTVCPGSSDPPEKIFNVLASENEVYTIY